MPEDLNIILDELRKLSPLERLKRLKQLQEEKQRQIAELKKREQEQEEHLKQAEELLLKSLRELMEEEHKLLQETKNQNQEEETITTTLEQAVEEASETEIGNIEYGIPKSESESEVRYLINTQEQATTYAIVRQIENKARFEGLSNEDMARLEEIAKSTDATRQYLKSLPQQVRRSIDRYNYIERIDHIIKIIKKEKSNLYKHSS